MALQKNNLEINFAQGLDTKTDPFQVAPGKFLALENSIFDKAGLLQKRNGYAPLTILPSGSDATFLTTFNGNLTAIGSSLNAFSAGSNSWVNKGSIQPMQLDTLPLIRNSTNQSQADSAIASNGLICTAYTDNVPVAGVSTPSYKYVVADSVTGQNILPPAVIPGSTSTFGSPRVFILSNHFVIVYSTSNALKFVKISINAPVAPSTSTTISSVYTPSTTVAFDAVVVNSTLYLAWNGSDGGGAIRMTYVDYAFTVHTPVTFAGRVATIMSVCADTSGLNPIIYAVFYNSGSTTGYALAVNTALGTVLSPTQIIASGAVANITSLASDSVCHFYYEITNAYSYDATIASNYIKENTITQAGVLGTAAVAVRSVGLASKAFRVDDVMYFLAAYGSSFQPTYFLINEDGDVISKLAYSEGGGYVTTGLPNVSVEDNVARVTYLVKDLIASVNKSQIAASSAGIYSQTGINLATFTLGTSNIVPTEIGNDLHLTGGFLWMYDGYTPVEHGFHLWPDSVETTPALTSGAMSVQQYYYVATYEWADNQGNVFRSAGSIPVSSLITGTPTPIVSRSVFSSGATSITLASAVGYQVGQVITDTTTGANIQSGTYITAISGNVITLSLPTAGNSAASPGDNISTSTICSVTVKVPTLRLTYKIANPVKIVLYRWSTAQQTYYQVTSLQTPVLNDTTVDSISYVDTLADSSIIGNNILYTTGGVLENIGAPATSTMTLFQSRLFLVDSEDKNLLWYSKQVIQATPVEMSDLLTIYVPPTTAAQGSTGAMRCLSALDDKLIIFKKDAMYYINGQGPDNTGANSQYSDPIFITATVGCDNQQSIVFMPQGLMFQSDKGIWLLGRDLSSSYIGAPVEAYTTDATVQSAVNVPGTNQVRFTLDSGITLVYDYYFGQWSTFTNVPAISSTLYTGLHTYVNSYGQLFQETPGEYLDGSSPVLMRFTTSWFNLAGVQGYERFYYMLLLGQFITPFKLNVQMAFDYNPSPRQSTMVTPNNFSPAYGGDTLWGSGAAWGGTGSLFEARVFPQIQKCEAFQISVSEVYDSSYSAPAGAGLTLSGLNLVVGVKKGFRTTPSSRGFG